MNTAGEMRSVAIAAGALAVSLITLEAVFLIK